ncbi:ATPase domain-containing protein [Nitrospira sp. Nam74]
MNDNICSTGVSELDSFLHGGLPRKRLYLVHGEPGAGKTTLALQFLMEGVRLQERCLYIALSETKDELTEVMNSHGWTMERIAVLDLADVRDLVAPEEQSTIFHPSEVDLQATTKVILKEVQRLKPQRIVLDSLTEMRLLSESPLRFRRQMLALKQLFAGIGCTSLVLDEMKGAAPDVQVESIAHGVIRLDALPDSYGKTRRQLRVTKMRGIDFRQGSHDYVIAKGGLNLFPRLVAAEHHRDYNRELIATGMADLDRLLGGGLQRGTSTLVAGPAGAGKTTLCFQLASALAQQGRRVVGYIFDENVDVLLARGGTLGHAIQEYHGSGRLRLEQIDPAEISPGEFAARIRRAVEKDGATVIILDSLNGYLKAMPDEDHLALQLHELRTYLGQQGIITLLVLSQSGGVGHVTSPVDVSYLADGVIVLRFYETSGEIKKAISMLKKRTGAHDTTIRDFQIDSDGIKIGPPLSHIQGVLTDTPTQPSESP